MADHSTSGRSEPNTDPEPTTGPPESKAGRQPLPTATEPGDTGAQDAGGEDPGGFETSPTVSTSVTGESVTGESVTGESAGGESAGDGSAGDGAAGDGSGGAGAAGAGAAGQGSAGGGPAGDRPSRSRPRDLEVPAVPQPLEPTHAEPAAPVPPHGGPTVGDVSVRESAVGQVPVGEVPVGEVPVGQVRVGEVPVGEARVGEVRVGEVPVGQVRVGEVPVGHAAVDQAAVGQAAVGQAAVGRVPAQEFGAAPLAAVPADVTPAGTASDGSTRAPAHGGDDQARRLVRALRPRANRGQLLAAALCALLGFALVVQVRQIQTQGLSSLRQSDLLSLLDTTTQRSARLEAEAASLQQLRDRLLSGTDRSAAAAAAAQQRLDALGVLAGTAAAVGPGIRLDIADPNQGVTAAILLDTLQELRDAGAEAVQIGTVRVVASTSFVDDVGGIKVDGTLVTPPYEFLVIGDSATLAAALDIPGGVLEVLKQKGATGTVIQLTSVTVSALRQLHPDQYARPGPASTP